MRRVGLLVSRVTVDAGMGDGSIPTHHGRVPGWTGDRTTGPPKDSMGQTSGSHEGTTVLGNVARASQNTQSPHVRLSSSLFPPDAWLANAAGVPLGALVATNCFPQTRDDEFGSRETNVLETTPTTCISRPPCRCQSCSAFLNGFCIVNSLDGRWACCVCGAWNTTCSKIFANNETGADLCVSAELISPNVVYEWSLTDELLLGEANSTESLSSVTRPAGCQTAKTIASAPSSPVVFVLDQTLDSDELAALRFSMKRALETLPDTTPVGIVTFGGSVSVYDLGAMSAQGSDPAVSRKTALAVCVSGHKSPKAHDLRAVLDDSHTFMANLGDGARDAIAVVLDSMCGTRDSLDSLQASRHERTQTNARTQTHRAKRLRPRSLGAAVETAAAVVCSYFRAREEKTSTTDSETKTTGNTSKQKGGTPTPGARLVVCLTGPPTVGPGAVAFDELLTHELYAAETRAAAAYVEELAKTLSSLSVTVDVFVCGNESSHLASVAPLASMTGGAVVAEDDFGEGFCKNLAAAARRRSLGARDSVLTIQVPPGMRVAQVIGPVAGMSREETALKTSTYGQTVARRATGDGKPRSETNANAFALKSAECSQAVSVFFEYDKDTFFEESDFVHLQFVLWTDKADGYGGTVRVARSTTVRVATTASKIAYARALDTSVVSILVAKKVVLDAQKGGGVFKNASEASSIKRLDAIVLRAARVFSPSDGNGTSDGTFPEDLVPFALSMYHLRRGPMLGVSFGHGDEKCGARLRFLNSGFEVSGKSLAPTVFALNWAAFGSIDSNDAIQPGSIHNAFSNIPAVDLALASQSAILVDHGDHGLFGWIGKDLLVDTNRRELATRALVAFAERLANSPRGRFPRPKTKIVTENSSAARFVVSRLAPGHRDAPHEQNAFFPPVVGTSLEQRRAFAATAPYTEEVSFFQWMRGMGVAAPLSAFK